MRTALAIAVTCSMVTMCGASRLPGGAKPEASSVEKESQRLARRILQAASPEAESDVGDDLGHLFSPLPLPRLNSGSTGRSGTNGVSSPVTIPSASPASMVNSPSGRASSPPAVFSGPGVEIPDSVTTSQLLQSLSEMTPLPRDHTVQVGPRFRRIVFLAISIDAEDPFPNIVILHRGPLLEPTLEELERLGYTLIDVPRRLGPLIRVLNLLHQARTTN
jgi:hypothetical protein